MTRGSIRVDDSASARCDAEHSTASGGNAWGSHHAEPEGARGHLPCHGASPSRARGVSGPVALACERPVPGKYRAGTVFRGRARAFHGWYTDVSYYSHSLH